MPRRVEERIGPRLRRRLKQSLRLTTDSGEGLGCALEVGEAIGVVILVVALVAMLLLFVVPLIAAVVDVVVLLALTGFGIVGRVLFRRPWTIEARAGDGTTYRWHVVGWQASGRFRAEAAECLVAGIVPAGAVKVDAPAGNLPP